MPLLFQAPFQLPCASYSHHFSKNHLPSLSALSSPLPSLPSLPTKLLNLSSSPSKFPPSSLRALHNLYTTSNASIHPGLCAHTLGREATDLLHASRATIASHLYASTPSNIIFTSSTPSAFILIAQTLASTLRSRDEVILWPLLPDALLLAWRHVAHLYALNLRVMDVHEVTSARLRFGDVARLVSPRTRVVVLQHTCGMLCTAHSALEEVAAFASDIGVTVVIDVTNALWTGTVDVRRLGALAVVIGGGEALGAPGGGAFVHGGQALLERLPPIWGGENAWEEVKIGGKAKKKRKSREEWGGVPQRFEVGVGVLGAAVGIARAIEAQGVREDASGGEWARRLREEMAEMDGVKVFGDRDERLAGMVCFCVEGVNSRVLASELVKRGVLVDVGYHRARIAHEEYFKCGPSLRVVKGRKVESEEDDDKAQFLGILGESIAQLRLQSSR